MKKLFRPFLLTLLVIPFFLSTSVPVFADYDYSTYTVDPQSTLAYVYWNDCGFNLINTINQNTTISVPSLRYDTGATNYTYQCRLSGTTYACGAYNAAGTFQGTYNWTTVPSHTETESNIIVRGAEIPWLSGNYSHPTSFSWSNNHIYMRAGSTLYISFITNTNLWFSSPVTSNISSNNFVKGWNELGTPVNFRLVQSSQIKNATSYTFAIGPNNTNSRNNIVLDFPNITSSTKIIPLYIGLGDDLNDSFKQTIGLPTVTETSLSSINSIVDVINQNVSQQNIAIAYGNSLKQSQNNLIESGNSSSQQASSNLSNQNTELSSSVQQINGIETTYNQSLNQALQDINLDNDLVQHSGFTNSALWVSQQFNRLVIGTPFELVLNFSMVTGLALVLIGKLRG